MITIVNNGTCFRFKTEPSMFSPNVIDRGTLAMLSQVDFRRGDKVLDIGCGYGVVGILAAAEVGEQRVTMSDISKKAVEWAKYNASLNGFSQINVLQSNGYEKISDTDFSLILSNPPYHTDFSVAKQFIEGGYHRLRLGGRIVLVVKRLLWYQKKMTAVFGGISVKEIDGYYVLISERRRGKVKKSAKGKDMSKKLLRKRNKMMVREKEKIKHE